MKGSLCWDCAKAINGGCPWSQKYEAVPGWKAKKTIIKVNDNCSIDSFVVLKCPLFEDDTQRALRIKFKKEYGMTYNAFYDLVAKGLIKNGILVLSFETEKYFKYKARQTFLRLKKLRE